MNWADESKVVRVESAKRFLKLNWLPPRYLIFHPCAAAASMK